MRTHHLRHTFIVMALASSPVMAASNVVTQDESQPEAVQMTPEEATLLKNMAAEEATMAEEIPSEESAAAEQMATDEATPAEEIAAEESVESTTVTTGTVIDRTGPAAPVPNIDMPVRGMHMDQVEQMYGKSMGINPPVGDPPITRWDYPGFAVYFEYSYVIQSVVK